MFSDMHYIEGAGDVVGMELWIVYARGSYWATVQLAGGEPDPPVAVPAVVSGQHVTFVITQRLIDSCGNRAPDRILNFDGTATKTALVGTFDQGRLSLKRGKSSWQ